jgi:uroporphyrinogen decarboxylase
LRGQIGAIHKAGRAAFAVGHVNDFETPFALRGRDQFFMDLGYQEEWLPVFIDCLADAAADDMRLAAEAGADIVGIGDDLGSQRGLLISPRQWRELFKPRLKRIIDAAKNANRKTAFFLHTDGKVDEIIPDLIEIGVDILNPIQPEVMDPARVKRMYGHELVFFGAISVQHTLPFGTPDEVGDEVKLRMETIGADGGYIMTPAHLINPDIPWANIVAFFDAARRYGRYGCRGDG